jgi:hypothetical protein
VWVTVSIVEMSVTGICGRRIIFVFARRYSRNGNCSQDFCIGWQKLVLHMGLGYTSRRWGQCMTELTWVESDLCSKAETSEYKDETVVCCSGCTYGVKVIPYDVRVRRRVFSSYILHARQTMQHHLKPKRGKEPLILPRLQSASLPSRHIPGTSPQSSS